MASVFVGAFILPIIGAARLRDLSSSLRCPICFLSRLACPTTLTQDRSKHAATEGGRPASKGFSWRRSEALASALVAPRYLISGRC